MTCMGGTAHDNNGGIAAISRRYLRQNVWLTAAMFLAGLTVMSVFGLDAMLTPLVTGAVFSVVTDAADAVIWRKVAERNPEGLTTFYTAVSGFRMLLALAVMTVYYIVAGSGGMTVFFAVFMAFYVMLLVHHSVFFAKVSNRS